jgi:hypothetical protein
MNAALLSKIFGRDQQWHGSCTVLMHGEAAVATHGVDSLLGGGTKQFAPRVISGRIVADAACLLQDGSALLLIQQQKTKQSTGEETVKQILIVADTAFVMGVEFPDTGNLALLGVNAPATRTSSGSHHGVTPPPGSGAYKR